MFIANVINRNPIYFGDEIGTQFITENIDEAVDWAEEYALQMNWPTMELRESLYEDYAYDCQIGYGFIITEAA
jgi:hypothetical protein